MSWKSSKLSVYVLSLLSCFVVAILCNSVQAYTVGIIVKDLASRGIDTTLSIQPLALGHDTLWLDGDVVHPTAYWDTAADYYISSGRAYESEADYGWSALDSLGKSTAGWIALGFRQWNEINLGTAAYPTPDTRCPETSQPYRINLGSNFWITRPDQDTVGLGTGTGFGIVLSDTFHQIKPLLVDKDNADDTIFVLMCAAEEADTIINTGDGNYIAQGRRVYLGLHPVIDNDTKDSVQWWYIMARACAWAAKDTLNTYLLSHVGFSTRWEIEDNGVVENSSGTDSIENYGAWSDLYCGYDFDEKSHYIKPSIEATRRKFINEYTSFTADTAAIRLKLKTKAWDITPPATYQLSFAYRPIKLWWVCGRGMGTVVSETYPWSCWAYRYYPELWNLGGAKEVGTDVYDVDYDSVTITQATTVGSYVTVDVFVDSADNWYLDTLRSHGWASDVLYCSNCAPGVEVLFYSADDGTQSNRPIIFMHLDSFSTTVPAPVIVLDPDSLNFAGTVGGADPPFQATSVTNSTGGQMIYTSTVLDSSWLTIIVLGGGFAPGAIYNYIHLTGLSAGTYYDTVTVSCAEASNTPQTYQVKLVVSGVASSVSATPMLGARKE